MHPDLTSLEHVDELHRLIDESQSRPVLLFKHSRSCGASLEALDELVAYLNDRGPERSAPHDGRSAPHDGRSAPHDGRSAPRDSRPLQYAMVTVQTHRAISNAVAQRLGVRHETPQALLIRDGRVVWSASHFRVTAAAVEDAIRNQS
jgi:hypothetical protein